METYRCCHVCSGLNLFDVYDAAHPDLLDQVKDKEGALRYVIDMLRTEGILDHLFYNRTLHDPTLVTPPVTPYKDEKDDLRKYGEEVFSRSLLSMAYDLCEDDGDSTAWRALRRTMVLYFLASKLGSQKLKYPYSTMVDLIVEEASSERTRARFDSMVTVNTAGRTGHGLWHDKVGLPYNLLPFIVLQVCETKVRSAKSCLRGCHGRLDSLLVEKVVAGMSALDKLCQHNRSSLLHGKDGKEFSHDLIGDQTRQILEEQISKSNPFGSRKQNVQFKQKVRGSPYSGLKMSEVERFVNRVKKMYAEKY